RISARRLTDFYGVGKAVLAFRRGIKRETGVVSKAILVGLDEHGEGSTRGLHTRLLQFPLDESQRAKNCAVDIVAAGLAFHVGEWARWKIDCHTSRGFAGGFRRLAGFGGLRRGRGRIGDRGRGCRVWRGRGGGLSGCRRGRRGVL